MLRNIKLNLTIISLLSLSSLIGCSSLKRLETAIFRDSTLNNLNPAPAKMSPPEKVSDAQLIDPVYNRTQADYNYTVGEALSLDGQTEKAIEAFKLTLIYDPQSVSVRLRLAAEYIKQGLMSEAIEQTELAIEADPTTLEGRLLLGGLYSTLKMYDVAMKQYDYLAIQYPENLDIPVYRGALLAEQKRYDESEDVFLHLAQHSKNDNPARAYYYLGRVQSQRDGAKQNKKAEQSFLKALSLDPENEDIVSALAQHYLKIDKGEQAFSLLASFQDKFGPKKSIARTLSVMYLEKEEYEKALKQLELLEGFEPDNLNIKVKIALILIEKKDFENAIDKLEEIIRVAPESDKIRFYLGAVYEEVKKPKLAIEHFSVINEGSVYFSEAAIHSAYLYKIIGDLEASVNTIEDAIKRKNDVPQFYTFYASLLDELKQFDKAISMLDKAVVQFPDNAQIRFFLGSMWDRKGDKEQTISHMKKVLEVDEQHVQALNYLAYTYADLGKNLQEAETLAFKALGANPDDGYILDTVGWVLFKQGRYEEAIKYLEAAYNNVNTESIIAEHLGDAYYRFELIEKAKKMYLKAVSVAEDESRISEIRTKLSTIEKQRDLRKPASTK
ncbi:MAG: tetratricopeptide repeat protein [Bdellovibrionales bacterium]|nr:tetratricopeptide repeat protein [Bdellovibrionales bacterium]